MSFNERRRRPKIVAPLTPNREQELIGGLKNALDRGEPLAKAKQSFLNAGYKPAEINAAVQKMPTTISQISKPITAPTETKTPTAQPKPKTQPSPATTTTLPGQKKKLSKKIIIILISSATLILIGAALLGIFWDKLF